MAKNWSTPPALQIDPKKTYKARMETDKGTMVIELFADKTPVTVNNFVFLSREGFYDGVIFHRVIDNFMVQGSDTRPHFIQKTMPKYPIIELMDMDSLKASYEFSEPIDFLFIDGDHQDDGIQRDLRSWLPKLSVKGIVAFHDYYNDQFPSIGRRVEEYTQGFKFVGKADSLIIKKV